MQKGPLETSQSNPPRPAVPRLRLRLPRLGWGRLLALALLTALLALRVWDPMWLEVLRHRTFDSYQQLRPRVATQSPVVIVDIDEKSLAAIGQWPWPRTILADLVDRLAQAGTVAIGLDIILAEPDRLSPALIAERIAGLDAPTRDRLAALPSNEMVLAAAIRRTRVVLAQAGQPEATREVPDSPRTGIATLGGDPRPVLIDFPGLLRNRAELEAAAAGRGLITFRSERDGIVRRVPTVMVAEGRVAPAFAVEILRVASGAQNVLVRRDAAGLHSLVVAGVPIATDRSGQLWLHHAHHSPSRFVSAADVLAGRVLVDRLKGKLALVGSSSVGLFDLRSTPLERTMPGVELHAQAIENMLAKTTLVRPHYAIGAEVAAAALTSLAVIVLVPMLGALPVLLLGAGVAALLAGGSWYMFDFHRHLIDFVYPLLASSIVFLFLAFQNYVREEARRTAIRSAFSRYISPALVEQLASEPDRLVLGGETREMTILFSDVRGFTGISESFRGDPQGLTVFMNRLLTPPTNAIIEKRGTIDKYMGDAIMAFWNAPLDDPEHARNACLAALEMLRRIERLNAERCAEASGAPVIPVNMGIGLNTGPCVVGNMGSDLRFDYSVLGDSVNVASRIESLTKAYGVSILLGSVTAKKGAAGLAVLPVDVIRVKGKTEPETIYALVGDAEIAASGWFGKFAAAFAAMRQAYAKTDWAAARLELQHARQADTAGRLSGLIDLFEERISAFETESPPPADWDGVFTMATKSG